MNIKGGFSVELTIRGIIQTQDSGIDDAGESNANGHWTCTEMSKRWLMISSRRETVVLMMLGKGSLPRSH